MSRPAQTLDALRDDLLSSLPAVLPDPTNAVWLTRYVLEKLRQHFLGAVCPNAQQWRRQERAWLIRELLSKRVPVAIIARRLGVHRSTVHRFRQAEEKKQAA